MPLFHHSSDDSADAADRDADVVADEVAVALRRFAGLTLPQRAAEILGQVAPAIEAKEELDSKSQNMGALLQPLTPRPSAAWGKLSETERANWTGLRITLAEAFQALVLARMLVRLEQPVDGAATVVYYTNSADGLAALHRGDVADVVARRLPD